MPKSIKRGLSHLMLLTPIFLYIILYKLPAILFIMKSIASVCHLPTIAMTKHCSIFKTLFISIGILSISACAEQTPRTFVAIADARVHSAKIIDIGEPGDSVGDILTFDQPLLEQQSKQIGNNSGTCIRTRIGHSFQCQWTLTLENGSIQVAGREFDKGTSQIAIVGGTGIYAGVTGEMASTNNGDGTFTQTLRYWIK